MQEVRQATVGAWESEDPARRTESRPPEQFIPVPDGLHCPTCRYDLAAQRHAGVRGKIRRFLDGY